MAFIPLYDTNPLRNIGHPWVAWATIAANVAVYFLVEGAGADTVVEATTGTYGLVPAFFTGVEMRPPEYWAVPDAATLVTYAFFHADFWHLAGNMIFVWVFGDNVEDALGHIRFAIFYVLCAIAAGFAFVLSAPGSDAPIIGASGAVAGIVAAYVMLYPRAKVWILALGRIPLRLRVEWVLGFWIVFQVVAVLVSDGSDQVAWWAHIGGLAAGAVLVVFMRRRGVPLFAKALPEPGDRARVDDDPPPHGPGGDKGPWE